MAKNFRECPEFNQVTPPVGLYDIIQQFSGTVSFDDVFSLYGFLLNEGVMSDNDKKELKRGLQSAFGFRFVPEISTRATFPEKQNGRVIYFTEENLKKEMERLFEYLKVQHDMDNCVSIRIVKEGNGGSAVDNPHVYLMYQSDWDRAFFGELIDGERIKVFDLTEERYWFVGSEGEIVEIEPGNRLDVFTQPLSEIVHCKDVKQNVCVAQGGGFRLELDSVTPEGMIQLTAEMVWDDYGPRMIYQNKNLGRNLIKSSFRVLCKVVNGSLILQEVIFLDKDRRVLSEHGRNVLSQFFIQDGEALYRWFRVTQLVRPSRRRDSVEGIFSTRVENENGADVEKIYVACTGVDGPEVMTDKKIKETSRLAHDKELIERAKSLLFAAQLIGAGLLPKHYYSHYFMLGYKQADPDRILSVMNAQKNHMENATRLFDPQCIARILRDFNISSFLSNFSNKLISETISTSMRICITKTMQDDLQDLAIGPILFARYIRQFPIEWTKRLIHNAHYPVKYSRLPRTQSDVSQNFILQISFEGIEYAYVFNNKGMLHIAECPSFWTGEIHDSSISRNVGGEIEGKMHKRDGSNDYTTPFVALKNENERLATLLGYPDLAVPALISNLRMGG